MKKANKNKSLYQKYFSGLPMWVIPYGVLIVVGFFTGKNILGSYNSTNSSVKHFVLGPFVFYVITTLAFFALVFALAIPIQRQYKKVDKAVQWRTFFAVALLSLLIGAIYFSTIDPRPLITTTSDGFELNGGLGFLFDMLLLGIMLAPLFIIALFVRGKNKN